MTSAGGPPSYPAAPRDVLTQLHSGFGLAVLVALAWLVGENRRAVSWRIPVVGVVMQVAIAVVLLKLPQSRALFAALNDAVRALQTASDAGTSFVFGYSS